MDDFLVIGGGIVGLAAALKLLEARPGSSLTLLEKEGEVAFHQTGRNSGVIHSGIYYAPGSLKARLCREGAAETVEFAREHGVIHDVCGKTIVATNAAELAGLAAIEARAGENAIPCERLDAAELKRREPNVAGLSALFVPSTGIVHYKGMCQAIARRIEALGGRIVLGARVEQIVEGPATVRVLANGRDYSASRLVACAGLQADRIAALGGLRPDFRIVPFRGEYFRLPQEKSDIAKTLIYPVPNPALPFLGIHLTRMWDGTTTIGPNALLGLACEGYGRFSLNARDAAGYLAFPGFWRLLAGNLKPGLAEMRYALFRDEYLEMARKYCPSLEIGDLTPVAPGIRAMAVLRDGTMASDFLLRETPRSLHVCNAPSPAATSALPIGAMIADRVLAAA